MNTFDRFLANNTAKYGPLPSWWPLSLPHSYLPHIRTHILDLCGHKARESRYFTLDEYKALTINSYERELIFTLIDADTLIYLIQNCLSNITTYPETLFPPVTYEEAAIRRLLPELLSRFQSLRSTP